MKLYLITLCDECCLALGENGTIYEISNTGQILSTGEAVPLDELPKDDWHDFSNLIDIMNKKD